MLGITNNASYEGVATLDPLNYDSFAEKLPAYNAASYIGRIADQYELMLGAADDVLQRGLDCEGATAALRDIDFIAGSLLRHGVVEVAEKNTAQNILRALADRADTVPRGTVYTYAAANPQGERQRSFTGTAEESLFIGAVRQGVNHLDSCMEHLATVAAGNTTALTHATTDMNGMVASMITVKRGITPEFFTVQMRPYFENLHVDGQAFAGAGGAQMQVIAIDYMLWGIDNPDPTYREYYADNVRYLTTGQRQAIKHFEDICDGRGLITLIESGGISDEAVIPAIDLLRTIKKFRYPHRKVAQDNFALRSKDAVGSGQYTPTILDHLIMLNEDAIARLESMNDQK